jgi:hypothetical protein
LSITRRCAGLFNQSWTAVAGVKPGDAQSRFSPTLHAR